MPYILKAGQVESKDNKTEIISKESTHEQYPSAKAVYDTITETLSEVNTEGLSLLDSRVNTLEISDLNNRTSISSINKKIRVLDDDVATIIDDDIPRLMGFIEKVPIKYVESPGADGELVCFRNLASGIYVLRGEFKICFGKPDTFNLGDHPFFTTILRGHPGSESNTNTSFINIHNPYTNLVRRYVATNDTYEVKSIDFDDLVTIETVEEMIGSSGGTGVASAVLYTDQELTVEQKAQARENIGAAKVGEWVASAVRYDVENQGLNVIQQAVARDNIDAAQSPFVVTVTEHGGGVYTSDKSWDELYGACGLDHERTILCYYNGMILRPVHPFVNGSSEPFVFSVYDCNVEILVKIDRDGVTLEEIDWLGAAYEYADDIYAVSYAPQELTADQKEQARKNIGASCAPLVFTVTGVGTGDPDDVYECSHTFEELVEALSTRQILCKPYILDTTFSGRLLPLVRNGGTSLVFGGNYGNRYITVTIKHIGSLGPLQGETTIDLKIDNSAITINNQVWGGPTANLDVNFTDTINEMIDEKLADKDTPLLEVTLTINEDGETISLDTPIEDIVTSFRRGGNILAYIDADDGSYFYGGVISAGWDGDDPVAIFRLARENFTEWVDILFVGDTGCYNSTGTLVDKETHDADIEALGELISRVGQTTSTLSSGVVSATTRLNSIEPAVESLESSVSNLETCIGDIQSSLNSIISIQEALIGKITFIIGDNTYSSIKGMTWEEWVDSRYNTNGFTILNDSIIGNDNKFIVDPEGGTVIVDSVIKDDYTYEVNYNGFKRIGTVIDGVLIGDCTGDGVINNQDMAWLQQHIPMPGIENVAADIDGDGEITLADLASLQQYLGG